MQPQALALLVTLLLVTGCAGSGWRAKTPTAVTAPSFVLNTVEGQTVSLAELRGRWVIVNFWASWCAPCIEEIPALQQLADRDPSRLVVLGINMREDRDVVSTFARNTSTHYPLLLNPDSATLLAYDVRALPVTAVVAPDGSLVRRFVGPLDPATFTPWLEEQFRLYP